MKNEIQFRDLRQLLLGVGFHEVVRPDEIVFHHEPSGTMFVFRRYRPGDRVSDYNLIEVQDMLDARNLMSAETFANRFRKAPA
jgi:hypothetical protein